MKRIYSLYAIAFALVFAGGIILLTPPRTVYACGGYAMCQYGEAVQIPMGATSCNCTDNVGCTWTMNGKTYSQKCASRNVYDEFDPIEP
jgi:hypothetical protein